MNILNIEITIVFSNRKLLFIKIIGHLHYAKIMNKHLAKEFYLLHALYVCIVNEGGSL